MKFTSEHFSKGINHGLTVIPGHSGMFQQDTSGMYISITNVLTLAQAAFDKWLSEQQVVYGNENLGWAQYKPDESDPKIDTHKGYLVCIEELAPKVCKHERVTRHSYNHEPLIFYYECLDCNKTLKPNWSTE